MMCKKLKQAIFVLSFELSNCYIFEKQGIQRYQIWHFLQNFPPTISIKYFPPELFHQQFFTKTCLQNLSRKMFHRNLQVFVYCYSSL